MISHISCLLLWLIAVSYATPWWLYSFLHCVILILLLQQSNLVAAYGLRKSIFFPTCTWQTKFYFLVRLLMVIAMSVAVASAVRCSLHSLTTTRLRQYPAPTCALWECGTSCLYTVYPRLRKTMQLNNTCSGKKAADGIVIQKCLPIGAHEVDQRAGST